MKKPKPTLEEVQEYFKDALYVKDNDGDSIRNFDVSTIYQANDNFYIKKEGLPIRLWGYTNGQQGYAEILKTKTEDKELVGYKLTKPQYKSPALEISGTIANWENSLEKYDISVKQHTYINRLKEAGVFDLWFEPVYKEEFKVGDICVPLYGSGEGTKKNFHNRQKGKPYKVLQISNGGVRLANEKGNNDYDGWMPFADVRKATVDEIAEFNKPKLPSFSGYEGKDEGAYIAWGCYHAYKKDIETLVNLGITTFTLKYGNRRITVKEKEFNIIKKYLN